MYIIFISEGPKYSILVFIQRYFRKEFLLLEFNLVMLSKLSNDFRLWNNIFFFLNHVFIFFSTISELIYLILYYYVYL